MNAGGRAVKRSWHKRTERGKRRKEERGRIAGAGKGKDHKEGNALFA